MTVFEQIKNAATVEEMALILSEHYLYSKEAYIGWLNSRAYTKEDLEIFARTK